MRIYGVGGVIYRGLRGEREDCCFGGRGGRRVMDVHICH